MHAFCSKELGLVTIAPTYATTDNMARRMGFPVTAVRVDRTLSVDLDAMANASKWDARRLTHTPTVSLST